MNYSKLAETAKYSAIRSGKIALAYYKSKYEIKDKSYGNPVTTADIAIDGALKRFLMRENRGFGWLSEETTDNSKRFGKEFVWIVDPIDGTKEFIQGIPQFTICIGLVRNGKPIVGVIYNPVTKELYWSIKGQGAYLNSKRIFVNQTAKLKDSKVSISINEFKRGNHKTYENDVQEIETVGSTAYKIVKVAEGAHDLTVSTNQKSEWDICGAEAILQEAGGILTLHNGDRINYNQKQVVTETGLYAGNPKLVKEIIELHKND